MRQRDGIDEPGGMETGDKGSLIQRAAHSHAEEEGTEEDKDADGKQTCGNLPERKILLAPDNSILITLIKKC